jgi:4-hydroxy-tetrahydrodipicolinate reductase
MGALIERRALEAGWTVAAVIDPGYEEKFTPAGSPVYAGIADGIAAAADGERPVALDFTHPSCACDNIAAFTRRGIPLVVGTTGWHDRLAEMTALVTRGGACLLWASNFSLGVHLFYKVAAYAAALFGAYTEYDCAGYEVHHNKKADSPSGTARDLAQKVIEASGGRKTRAVFDKLDRAPCADELHIASLRCGAVPGTHGLVFDSAADSMELVHRARSRDALVSGALIAAAWLARQAAAGKSGVWTFEDALA